MNISKWLCFLCLLAINRSEGQNGVGALNTTTADSLFSVLIQPGSGYLVSDLEICDSLISYFERIGDSCRSIEAVVHKAKVLENSLMLDEALATVYGGIDKFDPECDSLHLLDLNSVHSKILMSLEDYGAADSICSVSLSQCGIGTKFRSLRFEFLNNQAFCKFYQDDFNSSLSLTRTLYNEALSINDSANVSLAVGNLAALKAMQDDPDSAEYFLLLQLHWSAYEEDPFVTSQVYNNLAGISSDRGEHKRAIQLIDSGLMVARMHGVLSSESHLQENLAAQYALIGSFDSAYSKILGYNILRDSLLNTERIRAVAEMREKYESEKKAREIQEVKASKLDVELDNERVTRTRNVAYMVGAGILMLAGALWSRLRHTRRSRTLIQKERDRSEKLLLNILPTEVADELKEYGRSRARRFESVTVLFSDFQQFTAIALQMEPEELVAEIDHCFQAFDGIMEKYSIEKIKTIGDAYMAAGGLHVPSRSRPREVVLAALEMQNFMLTRQQERTSQGVPAFQMRVGIHTGPVVAGIVGVKKFQYDIWGDTVNTAARMESSGEVDKVNISESTYERLKQEADLHFEPRGKVAAKGKGEMEMFFVSRS